MRRYILIMELLFIVAVILETIEIHLSNTLASSGVSYNSMEKQIEELEFQNNILYTEILTATSLTEIERKAKEMGFVEPTEKNILKLYDF